MSEEIRVTRGVPTDEELAAIVGVLLRASRTPAVTVPAQRDGWTESSRPGYRYRDGRPSRPAASAWRRSGLPS